MTTAEANGTPPRYGDRRRRWQPDFVEYMNAIVDHPNYAGMPCTRDEDGKIDWTIPSNRPRGSKNWDGNKRRRVWWRGKAKEARIKTEGKWISRVAKAIHPFGRKPCQTCGRVMEIGYVYPAARTVAQLNGYLPDDAGLRHEDFLVIDEVTEHLFAVLGPEAATAALSAVFPHAVESDDAVEVARSIRRYYCSVESRKFSPGAMANPPDRLDGFHTYNLCCRASQDTGRTRQNLATYSVDRRAFEQWCEGDWAVADLVMSQTGVGVCEACGVEVNRPGFYRGCGSLVPAVAAGFA